MTHPSLSPQPGIWGILLGLRGTVVWVMCQGGEPDTGEFQLSSIYMNVCCSACENGCMVDGTCATAAN